IAFRRRVDDLERDEIGFAHFYRAAVAGDRHRLAQLLSDPRPKVDAALGPPLRIARDARLEPAVLGRAPIADFIVGSRPPDIRFVVPRHDLSIARTRLGQGRRQTTGAKPKPLAEFALGVTEIGRSISDRQVRAIAPSLRS